MNISIIAAVAKNNVIGYKNKLPWYLPDDLKNFKKITSGSVVIMGQSTYESIGKPLPNRTNIVLTYDSTYHGKGINIALNIDQALDLAQKYSKGNEVFIIGGASIYEQFIPLADKLYITHINKDFKGDTFFPIIHPKKWKKISSEKHKEEFGYEFALYQKV